MLHARKTEFQSAYVMARQPLNLGDVTCLAMCKQLLVPALRQAAVVLCWMTAAQHLLPEASLCEACLGHERHHLDLCSSTCGLEGSSMLPVPLLKPPVLPCAICWPCPRCSAHAIFWCHLCQARPPYAGPRLCPQSSGSRANR